MYYQSSWIEIYTKLGISLLIWNYSGYGRTTGQVSVNSVINDGNLVINYLKRHYDFHKIGVHGESIGGMVAVQICQDNKLDWLYADRTFSQISDVIHSQPILKYLFKIVTDWDHDSAATYFKLNSYKL